MPTQLTPEIIAAAISGYELQMAQIEAKIAELRAMLPARSAEPAAEAKLPGRKRRKFSAATRRRMREAQRQRWAKIRGESASSAGPAVSKPKRRISPEGMKRIIAAAKKRWALKRAETAKLKSAAAKKTAPARKSAAAKKAAVRSPRARSAKKGTPGKNSTPKKTNPAVEAEQAGAQ